MSEIASAYVSLIPSFRGGTREIANALGNSPDTAGRQAGRRFGTGLLGGLGGMKSQIVGVVGGLLAFSGVSKAVGFAKDAIFGFNSQLEQSTIAFTTMLGSGRKAQTFLNDLKAFAKSTPFEFPDLVHSSQKLIAMGINAKSVIPFMTGIGDAVAGLGGGAAQIDQVTTAIGQMSAKGKIQSDELLQLTEAGIPALKILADQYGVSTMQMQAMVTKGQVLSSKALPLLIAGLEHGTKSSAAFGGMMAKQSQTFSGAWSNISDSLQQSLATAFLPMFKSVSGGLQRLATWLSGPQFAQASASFTAGLSQGMQVVANVAPKVVSALSAVWSVVRPLAVSLGGSLVVVLRQVGAALVSVSGFLRDNKATITAFGSAVGDAVKMLAPVAPYLIGAFAAFKGAQTAASGVSNLKTKVLGAVQSVKDFGDKVGNGIQSVKDFGASVKSGADTVRLWAMYAREGATAALSNARAMAVSTGAYIKNAAVATGAAIKTAALAAVQTASATGAKLLAAAQWLVNAAMSANPLMLVVAGLVALGIAFAVAWNKSATFRSIVTGAFGGIKTAALAVADFFTKTIPSAFNTVYTALKTAWSNAVSFLKTWGPVALAVLVPFVGIPLLIATKFGKIVGFLRSAFSGARNVVSGLIGDIVSGVKSIPGKIWQLAGSLASAGKHFIGGLFDGIKGALTGAGRWAGNLGSSIVSSVKGALNSFLHLPLRLPRINTHIPGVGTVGGQTLIPKLAKGGIIPPTPGGRLVRVAEAGQAEAVIPLTDGLRGLGQGGGDAPLIGHLELNEISDVIGTANAVTRRIAMLGA